MIQFNSIPTGIYRPGQYVEFDDSKANSVLPVQVSRVLLFGQRLSTGTVLAGVPTTSQIPMLGNVTFA